MFKRLTFGVVEGFAVGTVVVLALRALGADWSSLTVVYAATGLAGVLTGLVAGRPVWKQSVKIEALLKSIVGVFLAVTTMFGLRKWLPGTSVDLGSFGHGALGAVPAAALPIVMTALAIVYEIDDEFGPAAGVVGPRILSEPPPSRDDVNQSAARTKRPSDG